MHDKEMLNETHDSGEIPEEHRRSIIIDLSQ